MKCLPSDSSLSSKERPLNSGSRITHVRHEGIIRPAEVSGNDSCEASRQKMVEIAAFLRESTRWG